MAYLDLIWAGPAMSSETFYTWKMDSMWVGGESSPLSLRKVIDRHGGEIWYQHEKAAHRAFFRFVLPVATPEVEAEAEDHQRGGRPEYYDFDLFNFADKYAWACASVHATMRWKMPWPPARFSSSGCPCWRKKALSPFVRRWRLLRKPILRASNIN